MINRLRTDDRLRSALRFAIGLVIADAVLLATFGANATATVGALAVIVQLYFLDFDGTWRERLLGQGVTATIGTAAVLLGAAISGLGYVAIGVSFIVAFAFAMARVLRGYVARSVVGLAAAFFWPVMLPAQRDELGAYVQSWLLGCAISMVVGLVVLPHRHSDRVRAALRDWLNSASVLSGALVSAVGLDGASQALSTAAQRLAAVVESPSVSLGAVGRQQRAVREMVSRALWAQPIVVSLTPDGCASDRALAESTSEAFDTAACLLSGQSAPQVLPNIEGARSAQLERMDRESEAAIAAAYPLRVVSLQASLELWISAGIRGLKVRRPDVGDVAEETPGAIVRSSLAMNSVWLRAAIMSGLGAAACVALVRSLGLEHGLWVVLAALITFQGTFSATAGWRRLVASSLGAGGGVLVAGAMFMLHLPNPVYFVLLPLAAAVAKYAQAGRMWVSQLAFTPFVLMNLVVLGATPSLPLVFERVEDISLGALVAAVLTFAVFPIGLGRVLSKRATDAARAASAFAESRIALAEGRPMPDAILRAEVTKAISSLERDLAAGHLASRGSDPALQGFDLMDAYARECLIAGDACTFLAERKGGEPVAKAVGAWWKHALDAVRLRARITTDSTGAAGRL